MSDYEPEKLMMILGTIRNVVLIITCGATVCGLYYMSRSWHSLWPLLMLLFLKSMNFTRD